MSMGKTYFIRKVGGGGGVKWGSEKKKASVGLFSTFRHPLGSYGPFWPESPALVGDSITICGCDPGTCVNLNIKGPAGEGEPGQACGQSQYSTLHKRQMAFVAG